MIVNVRRNYEQVRRYRASLDGVDVSDRCFYADDEAGLVRLNKLDENGKPFYDPATGGAAMEELRGKVVISEV